MTASIGQPPLRIDQAVILVGGLGTRLGELTRSVPKPLLEVGGRPFVEHLVSHFSRFGVSRVLLLAGYRGEVAYERYHGKRMFGADVSVAVESQPLGTAGALKFAKDQLDETFILANGDTFFDADLLPLIAKQDISTWTVAMLLRKLDGGQMRYGSVKLDAHGRIRAFLEKGAISADKGDALANAGIYLIRRELLLPHILLTPCSLETEIFPKLTATNEIMGLEAKGYFVDIGVPHDLEAARRDITTVRRRPAAFLDRDGVLNVDRGYTYDPEELEFIPTAPEAVRMLNEAGYYVFVVTNQGGIARGYYGEKAVHEFHFRMQEMLIRSGAHVDAFYLCPHHPEGVVKELSIMCDCRKPFPGLLERADREWFIDRSQSFLIGDKDTDVAAAAAFDIRGIKFDARDSSLSQLIYAELSAEPRSLVSKS